MNGPPHEPPHEGIDEDPTAPGVGDVAVLRTSRTMALGTIASRVTGFLRWMVIAAVVGTGLFADAYNVANTAPNIIYELLLGGVLTSIVVPMLVRAAARDGDQGVAYAQRLLTLVIVGLGGLTVIAVLCAPLLIRIYVSGDHPGEQDLATTFARLLLIQILFYGIGATVSAILNVRGQFAAPMWTPVLNNLVVIATCGFFLAAVSGVPHIGQVSDGAVALLALGTTAGIVVQTAALLPPLHKTGFRWKFRFDWRGTGLGEIATVGKWVFVYVAANQIAYTIVVRLATAGSSTGPDGLHAGYSSYFYAFLLFSLPHAIVTVSVITALLPRMSRSATDERPDLVRADISRGLRLSATLLVPATAMFLALGQQIAVIVYDHRSVSLESALYIGDLVIVFSLGLLPFSFFQLMLRAFYALGDTRTPALINIGVNTVNVVVDVVLYLALPDKWRIVGLAAGYAASYAVGLALMSRSLGRRLEGLDGYVVVRTNVRLAIASMLGGLLAWALGVVMTAAFGEGQLGAWTGLVLGVTAGGAVYAAAALRMRVDELRTMAAGLGIRSRRAGPTLAALD